MGTGKIGCCVFLRRPSSHGYRPIADAEDDDSQPRRTVAAPAVRVVAGREKREFLVDPFVLDREPFRVLLEMVAKERGAIVDGSIFIDIDALFFEHMLWSFYNDFSSDSYSSSPLFLLNLREIIEFYSQDS